MHAISPLLSDSVGARHRLKVILRVEVAVNKNDGVSTRQVESLAARSRAKKEDECVLIRVEIFNSEKAFFGSHGAVQSLIGVAWDIWADRLT